MGIVYAGRHVVIGKKVAIKVLRGEMVGDPELAARFLQEARSASSIGNPHIVDISDFGRLPDGSTYFVMELLEGRGLGDILADAQGPLPVERVVRITKQIARGLGAAHAARIVHRDLKPDNVMLVRRGEENDFVKILDFGIAKVGGSAPKMTRAGSVFGTPHYMSPQQASGSPVDHRTDIYSLGVIAYEMAAGRRPFEAANVMAIVRQHLEDPPPSMRSPASRVQVPEALDAIVLKCLSKDPGGRYATMEELAVDLERFEQGVFPESLPPVHVLGGGVSPRWPLVTLMAVVTALSLAALVFAAVHRTTHAVARSITSSAVLPSAAPTPAPPPPAEPPHVAQTPPASVALHEVLVSVAPSDATITRDGADLGASPVALHLGDGETATLVVGRKGYRSKTVVVEGREPKVAVALDAVSAPAAAPRKTSSPGIDDVGNPFAKKR